MYGSQLLGSTFFDFSIGFKNVILFWNLYRIFLGKFPSNLLKMRDPLGTIVAAEMVHWMVGVKSLLPLVIPLFLFSFNLLFVYAGAFPRAIIYDCVILSCVSLECCMGFCV